MKVATAAVFAMALGCGEDAQQEPVVRVVLELDPAVASRADEIDEVYVEIFARVDEEVEPIAKSLLVPAGAFADGESDFDFVYGDRRGVFDISATAGVAGDEVIARGETYEVPIAPRELRLPLRPFTNRWRSPDTIDLDEGEEDGSGPRVVVEDGGAVTVVWASAREIWSNGGDFGYGWTGAVRIASGPGDASRPRLALDDVGDAYLVWQQLDVGAESVFALQRTAGTWQAVPDDIDYSDDRRALAPEVAAVGDGVAVAVYAQTYFDKLSEEDARSIWAGFHDGALFVPGEPLNDTQAATIVDSAVALDPAETAFVVWEVPGAGVFWNHYASGEDPESRLPPFYPLDDSAEASLPRVVADDAGEVFAAWAAADGVHVASESAEAWSDLGLADAGEGPIEDLEIVTDGEAGVAVAFTRGGEAWGASWNGTWVPAAPIGPGDPVTVEADVSIASDGDGEVLAAFVGTVGGLRTLWVTERTAEGAWSLPAAVASADEISAPHVGVDDDGEALVVWEERVGGRTRIRASLRGL